MILPAVDYQKIYLEKRFPEILKKITETIDSNVDVGYCSVEFSQKEIDTFNASDFQIYLERLGFEVRFLCRHPVKYSLEISWI